MSARGLVGIRWGRAWAGWGVGQHVRQDVGSAPTLHRAPLARSLSELGLQEGSKEQALVLPEILGQSLGPTLPEELSLSQPAESTSSHLLC